MRHADTLLPQCPDICRGDHCSSIMICLILHTSSGASAALPVERFRRSIALSCALNQTYLPVGLLLRLNSRESVDWLMPTMRAIFFLWVFLWSKAKNCDLCSEISCLYICNTKIINLWESSKGTPFFLYCWYHSSGLRARTPQGKPAFFSFYSIEKQTQFLHFDLESTFLLKKWSWNKPIGN